MARIPGLKGSYHELKGGGYVVQFSMGWDEARGDYLKVRRNATGVQGANSPH